MKRYDESGRSIFEVVIVLSLGAFFVFGGLHLWRSIGLKNRSKVLIQHIVAMKTARQVAMASHSDKVLARSEEGPYGILLNIRNGTAQLNKDFYWINVAVSDSAFRHVLMQDGRERLDPCLIRESDTEVTFYFPKFNANVVVNEQNGPDKDYEPTTCPDYSICDDAYRVIGCTDGYYLNAGRCLECPENAECKDGIFECVTGYFKDEDSCLACGEGVQTCDKDGNPTKCQANHWGDDCSYECPTNGVQSCDINGLVCSAGYYEDGSECLQCGDNEYSSAGAMSCMVCDEGYTNNEWHTDCIRFICEGSGGQTQCGQEGECSYFISWADSSNEVCKYSANLSDGKIGLSEEKGCPAGQYCYLRYTKPDCLSVSKSGNDTTLYGFCVKLDETGNEQLCSKDSSKKQVFFKPLQSCPAGKYCYMRWNQDGSVLTGTTERSYGVCLPVSETLNSSAVSNPWH